MGGVSYLQVEEAERLEVEVKEERVKLNEMKKAAEAEQDKMKKELVNLEGQVKDVDGLYIMQEQLQSARKELQEECNDLESQKKDLKDANDKLQVGHSSIWIIHISM